MNEYEIVYILDGALTEADVQHSIEKTSELIGRHSGYIFRSQNMGKKTLAYPINKKSKGYYVAIDYCADNTTVSEMEHGFRLDERILRYLTVRLNQDVSIEARKQQLIDEAAALEKALAEQAANAAAAAQGVTREYQKSNSVIEKEVDHA